MRYEKEAEFTALTGDVFLGMWRDKHDSEVYIKTNKGTYRLYHDQDCCEAVYLESIDGLIPGVIGSMIHNAEVKEKDGDCYDGLEMWTFYELVLTFATITIRFNGRSNGYYSVGVACERMTDDIHAQQWERATGGVFPVTVDYAP